MLEERSNIRLALIKELKNEHAFWSYEEPEADSIGDEILIEKVLIHLDLEEINLLFKLYPREKILEVWQQQLLVQEPYYHGLNRFLAWYYFGIEEPDKYIEDQSGKLQNERFG